MTDATATPPAANKPTASAELPCNKQADTSQSNGDPTPANTANVRSGPARLLTFFASLRLTVALLFLTLGLIFFGTLAQTQAGIWQVMAQYFRSFYVAVPLDLFVPRAMSANGGIPGVLPWPGGATLGVLLLLNLCAAHAVRYKVVAAGKRLVMGWLVTVLGVAAIVVAFLVPPVANTLANHGVVLLFVLGSLFFVPLLFGAWLLFGQRYGIVLIHASIILLLVGEFATALTAHEGQMPIYTGQGLNWVQDIRTSELAVMVPAEQGEDQREVWAISQSTLNQAARSETPIDLPGLDYSLRVDSFLPNATLFRRSDETPTAPQATAGWGLDRVYAQPAAPTSGIGEQRVDQPAAIVTLLDASGKMIERVLVATGLELPEAPYRPIIQTIETPAGPVELAMRFKRTYLPYTVQLAEFRHDLYPGTNVPKNFSSDVSLVGESGDEHRAALIRMNEPLRFGGKTFFQSGWIPAPQLPNGQTHPGVDRGTVLQVVDNPGWTVPYIAVIVGGLGLTAHFLLSLINYLKRERSKQDRQNKNTHKTTNEQGANPWPVRGATLAALLLGAALLWPTARVPDRTPLGMDVASFGQVALSYGGRFKPWDSVARDTLTAIGGRERVERNGESIHPVAWLLDAVTNPGQRDDRVFRIDHADVKHLIGVRDFDRKRFAYTEIEPHLDALSSDIEQASRIDAKDRSPFERAVIELGDHLGIYQGVVSLTSLHAVALEDADGASGQGWVPLPQAVASGTLPGDAGLVGQAIMAYGQGDVATFNQTTVALKRSQADRFPELSGKSALESDFNGYAPFTRSISLYVAAGLCVVLSWLVAPIALRRAALVLLLVALVVHTLGLGVRVHLSGRPPVTNLYGSAVFVGWGVVILGLLIEPVTKLGLGFLVAALSGVCTLLVARGLDTGDTMAVLQAVLDTNFWLATHVIVITLGYSAMFVAALIGAVYLLAGVYTGALGKTETRRRIEGALFGVTCFALLLSFVGTILGGVWADQSWGRFWGWDPKENGAMMIVLWAALVVHARLGGMIKGPGVAALSVLGGVVTLWSWFGVNMLGVGLHSYGFMDSAVFWMLVSVALLCAIASIAMIPQRRWASFAKGT